MASETLAAWLLTVAVHASVLLGVAWLVDRGTLRTRPAWRETLWRAAFFGAVVTASVQVLLQAPTHRTHRARDARARCERRCHSGVDDIDGVRRPSANDTSPQPTIAAGRA